MNIILITPVSRPENLEIIERSINIPEDNYTWIRVFDGPIQYTNDKMKRCVDLSVPKKYGISGNEQRNSAINLAQTLYNKECYLYFLDDDTLLHKDLWKNISNLDFDFASFKQEDKNGNLRLEGNRVELNYIDSGNFIVSLSLIGDTRWDIKRRDADGIFANECFLKAKNYKYIPKILSVYNKLEK